MYIYSSRRGLKKTCCFSTRKAIVLMPRKHIQQSNGANPEPSAFCRKTKSLAKLIDIKMQNKFCNLYTTGSDKEIQEGITSAYMHVSIYN